MTVPERITRSEMRKILHCFQESGWTGMKLEMDGVRLTVGKNGPPSAPAATAPATESRPAPAPEVTAPPAGGSAEPSPTPETGSPETVDTTGCVEVRSPVVGAFWAAPSPGESPFVHVGQSVEVNQQLAIVEVMKLMSPIVAPQAGEVVQVCVTNAELVEFDQVLFLIRPSNG